MATVLLAWEIGEGISYARTLCKIARALATCGHQPVFALKNLTEPWPVIGDDFPVLQAPLWHPRAWRKDRPFMASTFADVLAIKGYASVEDLSPLVHAWQGLLHAVRPALIVAAYAPTACLAADQTVPVVAVANGWFGMPPATGDRFPPLLPGRPPVCPPEAMLTTVQEVQRRRGRPVPPTLPALLAAACRFLMMLPELDPYREFREEPYWDPLDGFPAPAPAAAGHSFFAYLNADYARAEEVLRTLTGAGWRGTAYLRGASADFRDQLRWPGLTILDRPVGKDRMLDHAVLIHHGGVGTSQVALAAGRPQLLFPTHLEQEINGRTLHRLGVAHHLQGPFATTDVTGAIGELLHHPHFRDRANAVSRDIQHRPRKPPLPAVIQCCEQYLALS